MKIRRKALEFILETAKGAYPREFIGLLRAEKGVITEILLFPGSSFNRNSSSYAEHMIPIDMSIIGSVHSHPSEALPSRADLRVFSKWSINIIAGYPYVPENLAAFDSNGKPVELEMVK